MDYQINYSSCTDIGQTRKINQDAEGHLILEGNELFIVCDGIGGYAGGEVASRLAVDTIIQYFPLSLSLYEPEKALQDTISHANHAIKEYGIKNPHFRNMGTTVVLLFLTKQYAYYAHVGDSRIYFLHDSRLKQITKDHSLVQELVDAGEILAEMARSHPSKNLITRGLGTPNPQPDIGKPIKLEYGDRFLLCTDGLTNAVRDSEILSIVMNEHPQEACRSLVFHANRKDGSDNITVQVVEIVRNIE